MQRNDFRTPAEPPLGDQCLDLTACTPREFAAFLAGVMHGARSQAEADDAREEARHAELHSRAVAVVRSMAQIEPRDPGADAKRAALRAEWWAERRGERRSA